MKSEGNDATCQKLLDFINCWVGCFIRLFGQELKERLDSANLQLKDWDISKQFNPKMVDILNTDPYRWHHRNSKTST